MGNTISSLKIEDRHLSPAEAEIWITVVPGQESATAEIRGRLVGPRCPGRSTVEVAYPLRPVPAGTEKRPGLTLRVVLPDPALWSPESPLQYEGQLELWDEGQRCEVRPLTLRLQR